MRDSELTSYALRRSLILLAKFLVIVWSGIVSANELLYTAREIHCAADESAAVSSISKLLGNVNEFTRLPMELPSDPGNSLHRAGSIDILLKTLFQASRKYPDTHEAIEAVVLQWSFCNLVLDQRFHDVAADSGRVELFSVDYQSPANWEGFESFGFVNNSDSRYGFYDYRFGHVPERFYEENYGNLFRINCLPHPQLNRFFYDVNTNFRDRLPSGYQEVRESYPYIWESDCSIPYTPAEKETERLRLIALAQAKAERERFAREKAAQERATKEILAREKAKRELAERQRLAREKAEYEQAERERQAREKAELELAEQQRLAREQAEREKLAREQAERERAALERLAKERAELERAELERLAREQAERERAEQERLAREQAERERAEQERLAREQAERERAEQERLAREQAEREQAERERAELERFAIEQAAAEAEREELERLARERAERLRIEQERLAREKTAREKAERERAEQERLRLEKLAAINAIYEQFANSRNSLIATTGVRTAQAVSVAPPTDSNSVFSNLVIDDQKGSSGKKRKNLGFSGFVTVTNRSFDQDGWAIGGGLSYKPIKKSYWFIRAGVKYKDNDEEPLTYSWGIGYDDWHTKTWSFQLNHWGPLVPGDGLDEENSIGSITYKFGSDFLTRNNMGSFVSLAQKLSGDPVASVGVSWSPRKRFFMRMNVSKNVTGGDFNWAYGFGYANYSPNTWSLEYNNWGLNKAFEDNFKANGIVALTYRFVF